MPLGKHHPAFYKFRGEPRENEGVDLPEKHIVIGEPIIGEYGDNSTDVLNEIEEPTKVRIL